MNNTIFRRKFVLGVLIALVLGLGVHGIVEAQLNIRPGTGSTTISTTSETVTDVIRTTVEPSNTTDAITGYFTFTVSGADLGDTIAITFKTGDGFQTGSIDSVTYTRSRGPVEDSTITVNENDGTVTFNTDLVETESNKYPWSGTIRVDYSYNNGYGLYEITVNPTDSTENTVKPDDLMRKAYVVQATSNAQATPGYGLGANTTDTLVENAGSGRALEIEVADEDWTQVDISITGGRLYLGDGALYFSSNRLYKVTGTGRYFTGTLSVFTDSNDGTDTITVYPNARTIAKVTVRVVGSTSEAATREIYYLHGDAALIRLSGNSQVGYQGSALSSPLVVKLVDSGANDLPVPGQTITFTANDGGGLSPAAGTTIAPSSTRSFPDSPINILTHTSSGEASVNFNLLPATAGQLTVTAALDSDTEQIFTAYVVTLLGSVGSQTITDTNTTNTPQTFAGNQNFVRGNPIAIGTSQANLGVQLAIEGGELYLNPNDLDLTSPNYVSSLFVSSGTDSIANAFVRVNSGSTAKVTATILGSTAGDAAIRVITYFYGGITFVKVSGDGQIGNQDTNLNQPFVVQVLDGSRPVSGQTVTLTVGGTQTGTLVKDPGFPDELYADNFPTTATVMTDSNGRASVLLQLSATAGEHTVTAAFGGFSETFTATGEEASEAARIAIVSGNNQSAAADHELTNPLVVEVRDVDGDIVQGINVRFTTDSGVFVDPQSGDPGSPVTDPSPPNTDRGRTVATDAAGRASVRYNVGDVPGGKTIRATITTYASEVRQEAFSVNGSGGTGPVTTPSGNNLSISPSSITTTAGSRVSVTVNANRNGVAVTLSGGTGLSVLETGRTGTAISFTIPSGTSGGRYTLRASASGYNAASITVTVQGTQTGVTPSVSPRSIRGAPRAVISVSVTLSGAPSGTRVDIGAPFNVSENTNSSGVAQFSLRLPDTAGSGNANVTASSYTSRVSQLSYTVTGSVPTTGTQARLVLPSGASNQLSGAAGSNVQLRVRVTNTAGTGLAGVAVTFRSNNLDLATRTSDANGNVVATYAVQTTAQTVTAVINDSNVDSSGASTVTFTVTPGAATTGPQSTRLNIFQTSTIAAVGASHPLTILMATPTGAAAVNQIITLTVRDSAQALISTTQLITGTNGRATTPDTFRLPTTAGVYTITATSGTETRTVTVTVVAVKLLKDSSDSVSGDDQEGDRGVVLDDPFVVKVVQDNTAETFMAGVPVTFTVTDGDGELSTSDSATSGDSSITVNSDSSGNARAYLVLGTDDEDNAVRASVGITGVADVTFTASGLLVPYELEIVSGNNQNIAVNRRSDPMIVRVTDEDGNDLQGVTVSFSSRGPSGATLSPRSAITDRNGEADADLVSRAAGTYTITARVTGIPTVTFTITVGDLADSIRIVSGNNQRGDPSTALANPLVVEVLDDDGDTVSGVTVTFRVTGGGGSLSATSVSTNSSGRAQTTLTLGDSPGGNSVRVSVSGVSTQVTFGATAVNPAPPEPVIHLGSGQRADSYWINTDSGTLHRLVGGSVEDIASGVENVVSLVVTPDRLYWVEDTGNNSGRLRRSNLNGSNIQLIRDLTATPAGITVDTANNKIYMTNAWGKVQAINADGSGYAPNLITGLSDPKDIAVGSGKVYWITGGGTVHSANVDGSGTTQIAGGYDTLGSIAVGGGKVFWTEAISESDGNIHSANLNGTGVTEVVSLLAAPYGISVDTSANKLYFTNSRGRIMQGNLDGSGIQVVASNLVALGDVSVPSGTAAPRPPGTFSPYDVNRDGTVDNTDASLVAAALGENPPSDPRLDVNGDGMVNFLDLLLVFDNRDNTNGAPVAVAKELPNVSREEIQKQIDLLLATDNHSATAQYTLAYLQNLLEVVTPEKTRLLANYPNPFNPETWIPYQLATSSEVQITIYNSAGKEVRMLSLGHQSKGYYTDRSSAAYWDGRNAIGEAVSSGVYFYTLTTDRMSATRKMLILK